MYDIRKVAQEVFDVVIKGGRIDTDTLFETDIFYYMHEQYAELSLKDAITILELVRHMVWKLENE